MGHAPILIGGRSFESVERPRSQPDLDPAVIVEVAAERPATFSLFVRLPLKLLDECEFRVLLERIQDKQMSRVDPILAESPVGLVPVVVHRVTYLCIGAAVFVRPRAELPIPADGFPLSS